MTMKMQEEKKGEGTVKREREKWKETTMEDDDDDGRKVLKLNFPAPITHSDEECLFNIFFFTFQFCLFLVKSSTLSISRFSSSNDSNSGSSVVILLLLLILVVIFYVIIVTNRVTINIMQPTTTP